MQTLIRILLLGIFAAAGVSAAVWFAVRTEEDSVSSQGMPWLLSIRGSHASAQAPADATGSSQRAGPPEPASPQPLPDSSTSSSPSSSRAQPPEARDDPGESWNRSADRQIAERAEAVTQQVDMMRALLQLIRQETESRQSEPSAAPPLEGPAITPNNGNENGDGGRAESPPHGGSAPLPGPQRRIPGSHPAAEEVAPPASARIEAEGDGALVVNIQNADIRDVLEMFSQQGNFNILPSPNVRGPVSASLQGVDLMTALTAVIRMAGFQMRQEGRFIYVGTSQELHLMSVAQERLVTRVYRPNYVSAAELQTLITPLLTAGVGTATVTDPTAGGGEGGISRTVTSTPPERGIAASSNESGGDDFAGTDVLIVRDFLSVLHELDQIVAEIDKRPRQVVIETMILSVRLDDSHELGVNFELLRSQDNARLITGNPLNDMASIDLTSGGLKFGLLDTNVGTFVNALESIGDTNVIASPRLMCLNKQRAEILIGSQLGYVSTTVTENAATQAVEFLEVGTQLRLRPYISDDGVIRMEVHPELSTGNVRIEGGFTLPDKEVTQVTTNVMCRNGSTIIIGGLIREDLSANGSHIPFFGTLPGIGRLFQQKTEAIDRREIIVLLTPRIVSDPGMRQQGEQIYHEFLTRQEIYKDKMSPVGKRYYGKRYLRLARAAWNAGDASSALRYANLSIHFNPLDRTAINLREEIVNNSPYGDATIDSRLREGLRLRQRPRADYSRSGVPWKEPPRFPEPAPVEAYHPGNPARIWDIVPFDASTP